MTHYHGNTRSIYLSTRISRNTGILGKLRHCTSLLQLNQLYYNLIYPYILCDNLLGQCICYPVLPKLKENPNKTKSCYSLPPCMDQIQTVHCHYSTYWIYLLLRTSSPINCSFLTSLINLWRLNCGNSSQPDTVSCYSGLKIDECNLKSYNSRPESI